MPDDNNKTPGNDNLTVGAPLNDPGNTGSSLANDKNQQPAAKSGAAEEELKAAQEAIKTSTPKLSEEGIKNMNEGQKTNMPKNPKPIVEETSGSFPPVSTESTEAPPPPPFPAEQQSGIPIPPQNETEEPENKSASPGPLEPPPANMGGIPPVITPPKPKRKFGGKKVVATILGLLLLVGGIGAGVVLVQNNQDIRNRAYTPEGANCRVDSDCGSGEICKSGDCVKGTSGGTTTNGTKDNKTGGKTDNKDNKTNGKGIADGECLTPTGSCTSGNDYFDTSCAVTETRCGTKTTSSTKVADGECLTPTGSCTSGNDYFDTSCAVTETRCGTKTTSTNQGNGCNTGWRCDKIYTEGETCQDVWPGSIQKACYLTEKSTSKDGTCCIPPGTTVTTSPSPSSKNTPSNPTNPLTAQCLNVQAYDTNWQQLSGTQLSSLKVGDKVRFVVSGDTSTPKGLDKARFTVNGVVRPEVTTTVRREDYPTFKAPSSSTSISFYDEYTIPEGVTSFSVQAELHHVTLGWFGK